MNNMIILETERLLLRRLIIDDAAFILKLLNTPSWLQFIGDRGVKTLEDARNYILAGPMKSYQINGFGLFQVVLKQGTIPIGICGLLHRDVLDDIDLGFALLPEYEGKGYAFEAASGTLALAGTRWGVERIVAFTSAGNERSIHLLEKLGFHFQKKITLNGQTEVMLFVNL